jgi:hypothetical protein
VALIFIGYPLIFETFTRGRTLGKMAMGIRVVRDDGGPVQVRHAAVRAITACFEIWMFWGLPALFTAMFNRRGKRLGDILAGTIVIRERVKATGGTVATMPPELATWAAALPMTRMPDDLAMATRQYLSRHDSFSEQTQAEMGVGLATEVARYVGNPAPPGTSAWTYLSAVMAERRARELARMSRQVPRAPAGQAPPTWKPAATSGEQPAAVPTTEPPATEPPATAAPATEPPATAAPAPESTAPESTAPGPTVAGSPFASPR